MMCMSTSREKSLTRGQVIKQCPIFSFLYLSLMLTFFLFFKYLSMREAVREALGNNSAIVSLVSLSIVSSV